MSPARIPTADRFWSKVAKSGPDECWEWQAYRSPSGYGAFNLYGDGPRQAHRVAYELLIAPIPTGLVLDHLCRNRACVNPAHLEPVTLAENNRRGAGVSGLNAQKTHCMYGHEFTPENTYEPPRRPGTRHCVQCARDRDRGRIQVVVDLELVIDLNGFAIRADGIGGAISRHLVALVNVSEAVRLGAITSVGSIAA